MDENIESVAKWGPFSGKTEEETLAIFKEKQGLTIAELMAVPWDISLEAHLPARSKTHLSYKSGSTTAAIWQHGDAKKTRIRLPLKDGWYTCDPKWGIPNGKPSSFLDSKAKYLWRWQDRDWSGLLVRGGGIGGRRGVVAGFRPGYRFGVLTVDAPKAEPAKKKGKPRRGDSGASRPQAPELASEPHARP